MNAREQLLKKRIESLEGQLQASLELLGRVLGENEYLASVACGFAWDLGLVLGQTTMLPDYRYALDDTFKWLLEGWTSAVEEASK